jgi:hypothetical protein
LYLTEEWNASTVVRTNTKPEILMRAGRVIETIKLPTGKKRSSEDMGTPATATATATANSNKSSSKKGGQTKPVAKKAKK